MLEITKGQALKMMLGLLTLVIIFHLAIITKLIPYTIVWAGKLKTDNEMYAFEAISIAINIFLVVLLLLKGKYIKHGISDKVLNIILWLFVALFALNTLGNLMAETLFEKLVFTPLTLVSAILLWIIVKKEKKDEHTTACKSS
ncbi:MAG: hypothetical protein Q8L90_15575 [Bacteroidota bacterium]|nr:hypothetical protein [Bacteroidota bacterium]